MKSQRKFDTSRLFFATLFVVVAGLWIMFWIYPYAFDDYGFIHFLKITENGLPDTIDWKNFNDSFIYRKQSDCLRLANTLMVFAAVVPKVVIGFLSSVMFVLAMWLLMRIAGFGSSNGVAFTVVTLLLMFFLPWWNNIAAEVYHFNYIWDSALMALAVWLFLRETKLNWFVGLAVGSLLGVWHEGFSFPTLAALGIAWLFWRRFRTPGHTLMLFALALGTAFLLWVPGMRQRTGIHEELFTPYYLWRTVYALTPVWSFFILSAINFAKTGKKGFLTPQWLVFAALCIFSSSLKFTSDDFRASWPGIMVGCVGTVWQAAILFRQVKPIVKLVAGICAFALVTVHLVYADIESFRERKVINQAVEFIRKGEEGPFFVKGLKGFYNAPVLAWGKPLQTMWRWPDFEEFYSLPKGSAYSLDIVPEELRNFRPDEAEILPCGWWRTSDGWIVRPHDDNKEPVDYIIESPMADELVWCMFNTFQSEADGRLYDHVFPTLAPPWARPVTDIYLPAK